MEINPGALTTWRRLRGLTGRSLAERAGISKSYLSDVELGKRRPTRAKVMALARALGVEPAVLCAESCPACDRAYGPPEGGVA